MIVNKIKNIIYRPEENWFLALRKRIGQPTLYERNVKDFILIKNPSRYWCADPFLFEKKGKTYVFAELFDKRCRRGVIGVAVVRKNGIGRFKECLRLNTHLSYPCVYSQGEDIYMIPENYQSGEISLYKAIKFPYKWEKKETVAALCGVDTTPFLENNEVKFYLTTIEEDGPFHNGNLWAFEHDHAIPIFEKDTTIRCAGHFIYENDQIIRPAQDDTGVYGNRLKFSSVENPSFENYSEKTMFFVKPPKCAVTEDEISLELQNATPKRTFYGIHTYNISSKYEIVDLAANVCTFADMIRNFEKYIKRRIKTLIKKGKQ